MRNWEFAIRFEFDLGTSLAGLVIGNSEDSIHAILHHFFVSILRAYFCEIFGCFECNMKFDDRI